MKKRPWPILILAFFHLLTPIGNIAVNSWIIKTSFASYALALLRPVNLVHGLIFFGIPVVSAALIYACKKWSYFAYIAVMSVPFVYSFYSWTQLQTLASGVILISFYAVNVIIVGYFMLPNVRKLYFDPRMRWWETKPRYMTDFTGHVSVNGKDVTGHISNISEGGIFFQTENQIPTDEIIRLVFNAADTEFSLDVVPVYRRGTVPAGYGMKFTLNRETEKQITSLIAQLQKNGTVVLGRVAGPEDSFLYWIKSLFKKKTV